MTNQLTADTHQEVSIFPTQQRQAPYYGDRQSLLPPVIRYWMLKQNKLMAYREYFYKHFPIETNMEVSTRNMRSQATGGKTCQFIDLCAPHTHKKHAQNLNKSI